MNHENKTKEQLIKELEDLQKEYDFFKEQCKINMLQSQLTENALIRNRAFLNETGSMAKVGGWEVTPGVQEVRWTDEVYRIHEAELTYLPTLSKGLDFYSPDSRPVIEKAINKAIEQGTQFDLELEIITAKGNRKWVHVIGKPNFSNGKLITISGTFQDITDRKNIANELANEKFLFTSLMDNLPDAIYFKDLESRFLRINKACASVNGFNDPNEAVGKSDFDLFTEEHSRPAYNDEQEIIRTGRPKSMEEKETRINQPDKWVSTVKMPLYNNEGLIIGTFGISKDITNQKKAEEQLILLANALKSIVECVSITDLENNILFLNESFLKTYGYESDDLIGKDISIIGSPTNPVEIVKEILPHTIEGGWNGELINKRKDGSEFPVSLATSVIRNHKQEPIALIGVASDITRRKVAEAEIRQMNEKLQILNAEKDKFFSILAHDLRGPLSAFVAATQILTDDIQNMDMADIKDITISMKISASNIYSLLENLLEWSRLMRNKLDFVPAKINLKEKIENCIGILSEYAAKKKIEIEISAPDEAIIIADSHMFETVIRNLVSNAIKFTPVGGKVSVISKYNSDNSVMIRISDNGIGMNEDIINKLFMITEKTNRSGTEGEPSTGLGLLLCKEFVEKHGSKIVVESEVGKGTTFSFAMQGERGDL